MFNVYGHNSNRLWTQDAKIFSVCDLIYQLYLKPRMAEFTKIDKLNVKR